MKEQIKKYKLLKELPWMEAWKILERYWECDRRDRSTPTGLEKEVQHYLDKVKDLNERMEELTTDAIAYNWMVTKIADPKITVSISWGWPLKWTDYYESVHYFQFLNPKESWRRSKKMSLLRELWVWSAENDKEHKPSWSGKRGREKIKCGLYYCYKKKKRQCCWYIYSLQWFFIPTFSSQKKGLECIEHFWERLNFLLDDRDDDEPR